MAVNLTRIYTRTGDGGETHLGDMSRVPKTHPRIEAYGDVDELNSHLGVVLASGGVDEEHAAWLQAIQNDLFDVGADLAVPPDAPDTKAGERLRVTPEQTTWLEERCDEANASLAPLRSFLLPGGTLAAAQLHVARTICRRAERRVLDVEDHSPETRRYLNRLSDLLFILARAANTGGDEPLWKPGAGRS
jgi:cob(I)alamin adenosyltransferase